ncbi:hypothetical protein A3739_17625 [Oleiphilus sp. HI0067]|nr:hypothetical protein A3739_17625 [Oleiphilus sp. HI0067]
MQQSVEVEGLEILPVVWYYRALNFAQSFILFVHQYLLIFWSFNGVSFFEPRFVVSFVFRCISWLFL